MKREKSMERRTVRALVVLTPDLVHRLDVMGETQVMSRSLLIRLACERMLVDFDGRKVAM